MKSEYSYRQYTTADGLPNMTMESVFKDSKGFLWQGTLSGGSSFDGFKFKSLLKTIMKQCVKKRFKFAK